MNREAAPIERSLIIYDGDCVFCNNYVRLLKLKEAIGEVELVDARSGDPRVERFWHEGYDLNQGMLFIHKGRVYHGDEAINVLASLSSNSTIFNRINGAVLSNVQTARVLYPLLKLGRRFVLLVRGKKLLRHPAELG